MTSRSLQVERSAQDPGIVCVTGFLPSDPASLIELDLDPSPGTSLTLTYLETRLVIDLPCAVDEDDLKCQYSRGRLSISMPFSPAATTENNEEEKAGGDQVLTEEQEEEARVDDGMMAVPSLCEEEEEEEEEEESAEEAPTPNL